MCEVCTLRVMFPLATILALIFPQAAPFLEPYLVPLLALAMTLAVKDLHIKFPKKREVAHMAWLLGINYIALGGSYILAASILIDNPLHRAGFFLIALVPPAINIVPFSLLFKGNIHLATITEVVGYLLALFVVPIGAAAFFDASISLWRVFKILLILILVPIFLGKLIHTTEKKFKPFTYTNELIVLANGFIMYILIGLNRDTIFTNPQVIWPIILVLIFVKFIFVYIVYKSLKHNLAQKDKIEYVLFASFKNVGVATAIGLVLFGPQATLPMAFNSMFFMALTIILEWVFAKYAKKTPIRVSH